MSGYTKLFSSLLTSTIWNEDNATRILWITMLALADKSGIVEGSIPGLAILARLPIEETRAGIEKLLAPDADSRTKDHAGRRIQPVQGGWLILNHSAYRAKLSAEERREYQAAWIRKKRSSAKSTTSTSLQGLHIAEAEAEAVQIQGRASRDMCVYPTIDQWNKESTLVGLPMDVAESAWHYYEANGWKQASGRPIVKWKSAVITCRNRWNKQKAVARNFNGELARIEEKIMKIKQLRPRDALGELNNSDKAKLKELISLRNLLQKDQKQ